MLLQNLPRSTGVSDVCRLLDQHGLMCAYDVVFMPVGRRRARVHATVNFLFPESAAACIDICDGMPIAGSQVNCSASFAECQGDTFVARCIGHVSGGFSPMLELLVSLIRVSAEAGETRAAWIIRSLAVARC